MIPSHPFQRAGFLPPSSAEHRTPAVWPAVLSHANRALVLELAMPQKQSGRGNKVVRFIDGLEDEHAHALPSALHPAITDVSGGAGSFLGGGRLGRASCTRAGAQERL
jgi:hypothetical protein